MKNTYHKSKDGVISRLYSSQKSNSKKLGRRMPDYTKEEFYDWAMSQTLFHELYNEWVNSEYKSRLKPSVNRKNDFVHYCFGNIELMTWGENRDLGHKDRLNGVSTSGKSRCKSVIQLDLDGNTINEFHSIMEAQRQTGSCQSHIVAVCKGKLNHTGGFKWKYKGKDNE